MKNLSRMMADRQPGSLPGSTTKNPGHEHAKAITTRSGKTVESPPMPEDDDGRVPREREEKEDEIEREEEEEEKMNDRVEIEGEKVNQRHTNSTQSTVPVKPIVEKYKPPIPYPNQLRKEKEAAQQINFLEIFKQININLPFIDVIAGMPKYAKFLKDLLSNKLKIRNHFGRDHECRMLRGGEEQASTKDVGSREFHYPLSHRFM